MASRLGWPSRAPIQSKLCWTDPRGLNGWRWTGERCPVRMWSQNVERTELIPKGKKWGLGVGRGLVRVFRIPLKRRILLLSKAGSHAITKVTLQHIRGFHFSRTHHVYNMSRPADQLRRNVFSKQGRTVLSQEGQREGQELDNRMSCHLIRDTILLQVCTHASSSLRRKEGRNSHVRQDHIGVCHMQTNMNKKESEHMNYPCAHKKWSDIDGRQRLFGLVTRPVRLQLYVVRRT
jgi:hypothetical protein